MPPSSPPQPRTGNALEEKERARCFLESFENSLNQHLPGPSAMVSWIRRTVVTAKSDEKQTHLRNPEAAFLNGKVVPLLFQIIQEGRWGLTQEESREALLNEYHRTMPEFCTRSPNRSTLHPFEKAMDAKAEQVYRRWENPEKGRRLRQACPDFALKDPFPVPIVFEGKYFARGSRDKAKRELVVNIYQALFYRSLPPLAATTRHPAWNYNYTCMLAFDASPEGTLRDAWESLDSNVRSSFWEGANVYVMVLRGNDNMTDT